MTKQINVFMVWSIVCMYYESWRNSLSGMIKKHYMWPKNILNHTGILSPITTFELDYLFNSFCINLILKEHVVLKICKANNVYLLKSIWWLESFLTGNYGWINWGKSHCFKKFRLHIGGHIISIPFSYLTKMIEHFFSFYDIYL